MRNPDSQMNFHVIAIEETEWWRLEEKMMQVIERIETVYLYDSSEHTYLCEMTPSYTLYPIETRAVYKSGFDTDDSREGEQMLNEIELEILSNKDGEVKYYHVSHIESLVESYQKEEKQYVYKHHGGTGVSLEDSDYESQVEGMLEYFRCNSAI